MAAIRATLPELPEQRKRRFLSDYGLSEQEAGWLSRSAAVAGYFEETARRSGNPRAASNWIMGPVGRHLNERGIDIGQLRVDPAGLCGLIELVDRGAISGSAAKTVFERMVESGESAQAIVESEGLAQIDDAAVLGAAVRTAMEANPEAVASYRAGKTGTLGFLVGQVMRQTRGQANPRRVRELLQSALDAVEIDTPGG